MEANKESVGFIGSGWKDMMRPDCEVLCVVTWTN